MSTDGTSMTFVSDIDIPDRSCSEGTPYGAEPQNRTFDVSGYLYLRDGVVYRIDSASVSWIRDRNGNTVSFPRDANGDLAAVTDSLGRQTTFTLGNAGDNDINYQGFGGAPRTIKVYSTYLHNNILRPDQTLKTDVELFPGIPRLPGSTPQTFDPIRTSAVELPDGRLYRFFYNSYGELARVELPTGGAFEYDYGAGVERLGFDPAADVTSGVFGVGGEFNIYRRVIEERVYPHGGSGSSYEARTAYSRRRETYAPNSNGSMNLISVENPDFVSIEKYDAGGNRVAKSKHYYYDDPLSSLFRIAPSGYSNWNEGREYKTEDLAADGLTVLRRLDQEWAQREHLSWWSSWCATGVYCYPNTDSIEPPNDVRLVRATNTLADTNQVTKQEFGYDQFNNPTDILEYDYGAGAPPAYPLRHTHTDYLTVNPASNIDYTAYDPSLPNHGVLRNLPKSQAVYAVNPTTGAETLMAQSSTSYDEAAYPAISYGSVTGWIDPGTLAHGNATTTSRWLDTSSSYLQAHAQYDQCGNVRNAWDAKGTQSQIEYSSAYAYAFPTLTRTAVPDPSGAYASTASLVTTSVYDFDTGHVTSTTDANGQTTSFEYNDLLDRLTKVNLPDGGRTTHVYVDTHQCGPYVETRTLLDSSGREADSYQFFDGLGRPYRAFTYENQDTNNPYLTVDTQYDAMGRAWRVSNPYRSAGCTSTVNPSGRWTQTAFDALGRPTQVTTADSAVVTTAYSGNTVTVTDPAGKKRRSVTDALGRLARVDEPDSNGNLGLASAPAQPTSYTYDALGNLRKVDQGGQQRFFMYDSLGRLLRAKNPEQAAGSAASNLTDAVTGNTQWSMAYGYDNNGNLTARVDARNVTTTYAYDALNRNTTVRYTDGTKDIDRHYDGAIKGKGRFWYSNWDPNNNNTRFDSFLAIDEYDAGGRPKNYRQLFFTSGVASQQFNVTRTYDKAGHVLTQTYPSGHTVNYGYDIAGRINSDTGNLGDGVSRTYSTGITYSELGGLQQEQFGTQVPLYHKLHYNVRGQLYDIRLSTYSLQANEWDWNRGCLAFYYGGYAWGQSGPLNNGNLSQQQHWAPANDAFTDYGYTEDHYSYDSVNRLASTNETHGGPWGVSAQDYIQTYTYDRFGNRTIDQNLTSTNVPHPNYTADTNTNRLIAPAGYTYSYDFSGNQTYDNYTGQGARTYDAENRMKQAQGSPNNQWQTYTYDADGHRIKRNVNGVETWQLYGMDGELLAEYQSGAAPYLPATEYGYRGGELLTTITSGDTQRLSRFVTNLYYGALQRDPTAAELQDKINQLAAAGAQGQSQLLITASQIARSLFTSTNYGTSPYRSDAQYVTDLYYAYLQRGPDDGGLNFWAGQAASSRANVCNAFEASGEFQTLVATLYGTSTSDNQRTEQFVNNFYLGAYGSNATATELQQQRDALNAAAAQGQAQVQTQAETVGRSLFVAQVNDAGLSNTQFVTNLYEAFLQRGPDAGGLGWWSGQASIGQGRQNVLGAFATCGAFRELAGTLYRDVNWLVADHLATPRMIVNKSGSLSGVKRHDYLPFGEELYSGTGGRTTTQGYTGDSVRQKFTGYEADSETQLNFAQARYQSSVQGRFTSVDPLMASASVGNPQSFNRYTYVVNNPVNLIDPTGLVNNHGDSLYPWEEDHWGDIPWAVDGQPQPNQASSIGAAALEGVGGGLESASAAQDTVKTTHNDPIILDYSVRYLDKTSQGEVPVGGRFQIKYKYSISIPSDGSKPGDAGGIEPVGAKGSFTDAFSLGIAAEPKIKINVQKESMVVEKTETFIVNMGPANTTGALNYRIAVTAPNGSGTVTRSAESSWRKPLFGKGPPDPIEVRNVPLERKRKVN